MNPWQEWKAKNLAQQKQGIVTPMALFNPDTPEVDETTEKNRINICEKCPHFMITKQCSQCGCFMPAKVKLLHAACPKELW